MTKENLTIDENLQFSGDIRPINGVRIINELAEEEVEIRYNGSFYDSEDIPVSDVERYAKQLLSENPNPLEEKVEQDTIEDLFHVDKRDEDINNQMNSTPLPRPNYLEVENAEVLKAGISGSKVGCAIAFDVKNTHEDYEDQATLTFNYWEDNHGDGLYGAMNGVERLQESDTIEELLR